MVEKGATGIYNATGPDKPLTMPVTIAIVMLAVAALTGLSSFVYEVVWIRMLTLVLGAATTGLGITNAGFSFACSRARGHRRWTLPSIRSS